MTDQTFPNAIVGCAPITCLDHLLREVDKVAAAKTPEEIRAGMKNRGSRIFLISRAVQRYLQAQAAGRKFGFIGVGCIAFANTRLEKYCRLVGLTIS